MEQIISDRGFGRNECVETTRRWCWSPRRAERGKMAVCLGRQREAYQRGVKAGYASFTETFPIWDLPLNHPVSIAYEAATADLDDVNADRPLPSGSL